MEAHNGSLERTISRLSEQWCVHSYANVAVYCQAAYQYLQLQYRVLEFPG